LLCSPALFGGKMRRCRSADVGAGTAYPQPQPQTNASPDPGSILDGLGGLIKQFQQKGLGDAVDSWINTGANKDVSSGQVSNALPSEMVDELAKRTGLSRDQVIGELVRMLPNAVDRLTPNGRLPTQAELQRLLG
jgi:uncharacterized protein YidB (DUF937 family)